jgi:hypothetical protein
VADADVIDSGQLSQAEVTHAGTRVDEHGLVKQKGGGAATSSDGAGAA